MDPRSWAHKKCWFINAWRFDVLTGMRRGEIAGLEWTDIDEDSILSINRAINDQKEETLGKNDNAVRSFVLSKLMKEVLADQRALLKANGIISPWVFPDESGNRAIPDHIYKRWDRTASNIKWNAAYTNCATQ